MSALLEIDFPIFLIIRANSFFTNLSFPFISYSFVFSRASRLVDSSVIRLIYPAKVTVDGVDFVDVLRVSSGDRSAGTQHRVECELPILAGVFDELDDRFCTNEAHLFRGLHQCRQRRQRVFGELEAVDRDD